MDIVGGLRQFGLTEYEARAYLALLAHPSATGYEVAKYSGLPRAKIYEVLTALTREALVDTSQEEGHVRYHPLAPEVLIERHLGRTQQVVHDLAPKLQRLTRQEDSPALVTVRTHERVLDRARDVVTTASRRIFAAGWPTEMVALGSSFEHAESRRVAIYALVYGEAVLPIAHVTQHPPIEPTDRAATAPWLVVVADHREVLLADATPGTQAVALWTRNRTLATVAAEYVKHNIYQVTVDALLRERGITLDRELAHLQTMWFEDRAGEALG